MHLGKPVSNSFEHTTGECECTVPALAAAFIRVVDSIALRIVANGISHLTFLSIMTLDIFTVFDYAAEGLLYKKKAKSKTKAKERTETLGNVRRYSFWKYGDGQMNQGLLLSSLLLAFRMRPSRKTNSVSGMVGLKEEALEFEVKSLLLHIQRWLLWYKIQINIATAEDQHHLIQSKLRRRDLQKSSQGNGSGRLHSLLQKCAFNYINTKQTTYWNQLPSAYLCSRPNQLESGPNLVITLYGKDVFFEKYFIYAVCEKVVNSQHIRIPAEKQC